MSGNMRTQSSILDLNETLNESDRSLNLREMYNYEYFERDYNHGQSSQLELMDNARTSSNIPLSLNFNAIDHYRDNVMRDQHVVAEDIENGDQANYGFVDEWQFEHHEGVNERIFNYVFWTFKPCVDGFRYCRPVILIDGTHVYGKYDIKLLIAVAAHESLDTWTKFLSDLHQHVMRGRQGITLISDRHHDILGSVSTEHNWQASFAYQRYCLRHLKANCQRTYKSVRLNNLLWAAANATQEKKFLLQMELIKETHFPAYEWLMNIDLEKRTIHKDNGRRWGMLITNSSESFNGMLKSARGLPVTAMVKMPYSMIVDRFVQRSKYAKQLLTDKQKWMPNPFKKFEEYRKKASMHSIQNYLVTDNIFEVRTFNSHHGKGGNKQIVNETQRACTCEKWQSNHFPCSHIIRVFEFVGNPAWDYIAFEFSMAWYKKAYSGQLIPLGDEDY
ncbi:uncharacterized protein LOC124897876 [Capsicum annuum]|uniref:uncharacterized protein LOC124897876 n=1 Tax=Capsicum annuum TaxID=4072 RepID=UPI001FB16F3E|nr:uncharacterized protein LOC124897876 [Capsicum annuum]